ncbi:MAG TPA: beta-ketoacyl-ACP synthase II [Thermoleophilaceae bacterium]|jgi:3-oxoacyl-[acyl-carrier-protein] synthase II
MHESDSSNRRRRVVVTGVGAVTPLGAGAQRLFDGWMAGESGIEDGLGRCQEFDALDTMDKKDRKRTDRFTHFAIAASAEAIADAGWVDLPTDPTRIGCVIGTGVGGLQTAEDQYLRMFDQRKKRISPLTVPLLMPNAAAGNVALRHGLQGPAFAVSSACAAGTDAIGAAVRLVRSGEADAVVTGGAEAPLTRFCIAAFASMEATSECGISRPFDARRDGFVMGEGAGALVLEDAELARVRGARVLAEVIGFGSSADAYHMVTPDPAGDRSAGAIQLALDDASLLPTDVDYVNAHGTSTELNDRSETAALKIALGEHAMKVPVSSTKSATGHLIGAAGAIEAVATVLALRERVAPPTLNYEEPEEGMDLDYVPGTGRPLAERANGAGPLPAVGISNSFGFGGHNSVLCLRAGP